MPGCDRSYLDTPKGVSGVQQVSEPMPAGNFAFTGLPGWRLRHHLFHPFLGFAARTVPLHLTKSIPALNITLALASVSQEVTVDGGQVLSTDAAANRDVITITGDELRKLPVFDQDYIGALTQFLDPSSVSSGGVTLVVDGIEMKSVGVSPSAIQEVRINNDPYSTEFSRPGRGRIEITTKPGSPEFHGEFNFLFRDAIFNARNYFAVTRPPEARRLFEGHFTGPVGRGGSILPSHRFGRVRDNATPPLVVDGAVGLNGPVIVENVVTPHRNSQAALRVTHDFLASAANRLQIGYNYEGGSVR